MDRRTNHEVLRRMRKQKEVLNTIKIRKLTIFRTRHAGKDSGAEKHRKKTPFLVEQPKNVIQLQFCGFI